MIEWLWGLKTVAIFDVWTIVHIFSGMSTGHIVKRSNGKHFDKHYPYLNLLKSTNFRIDLFGIMFLAYLWETLEHYLEGGLAGSAVEYWFQGVEFWPNRLITDPLMMLFGYLIALKYPAAVIPARILAVTWLLIHIFVFPHSMYLHNFI